MLNAEEEPQDVHPPTSLANLLIPPYSFGLLCQITHFFTSLPSASAASSAATFCSSSSSS